MMIRWWRLALLVLLLPQVCGMDLDVEGGNEGSGAAEEAHELLRRGLGQVDFYSFTRTPLADTTAMIIEIEISSECFTLHF